MLTDADGRRLNWLKILNWKPLIAGASNTSFSSTASTGAVRLIVMGITESAFNCHVTWLCLTVNLIAPPKYNAIRSVNIYGLLLNSVTNSNCQREIMKRINAKWWIARVHIVSSTSLLSHYNSENKGITVFTSWTTSLAIGYTHRYKRNIQNRIYLDNVMYFKVNLYRAFKWL